MFIVAVPLVLVLFVAIGIGAGINQAIQVNIMPAVSLLCAIFAIVGIVKSFSCEESRFSSYIRNSFSFNNWFILKLRRYFIVDLVSYVI